MYWNVFLGSSITTLLYTILLVECNPVIHTNSGIVQGITIGTPTGKTVDAFLGIPYADAPIGSNRFLPPKVIEPWKDILVADHLPMSCFQSELPEFKNVCEWCAEKENISEDCLFLNIWIPNPMPENSVAVMVWIHGGGLVMGSSSGEKYNGATLASEENVIVVSINYRLNVFGFFHLENSSASGNMGLLDQVASLKWININIHSFGGDPSRVMIFGESSGGISVGLHLISPLSKNLFNNAVIMSGVPSSEVKFSPLTKKRKTKLFSEWIARLNCSRGERIQTNDDVVQCLRQLKPDVLISHFTKSVPFLFSFVPDNNFLESDVQMLTEQKRFNKANVILGSTTDDASFFMVSYNSDLFPMQGDCFPTRYDALNYVKRLLPHAGEMVHKAINFFYTDWLRPNDPVATRQQIIDLATDYYVVCDTNYLTTHLVETGRSVYRYIFNHIPSTSKYPKWMGSVHTDEIDFVFGRPLNSDLGFNKNEVKLSKKIMQFWANFAKYGNPNGKVEHPLKKPHEWPQYTLYGKEYIDLSTNISAKQGIRDRECAFWSQLVPELNRLVESQKRDEHCSGL